MRNTKVLVVSAEPNVRRGIRHAAEYSELSLTVEEMESVNTGLARHGLRPSDVVMLDIDSTGSSAANRVLQMRAVRSPVVIMSEGITVDDAVDLMRRGAADVLRKPITPQDMSRVVSSATRSRARRPDSRANVELPDGPPSAGDPPGESDGSGLLPTEQISSASFPIPEDSDRYGYSLEQARAAVARRDVARATDWVRNAISADPGRPGAYNILGVIAEISHDLDQAQKYYRASIAVGPAYGPAYRNLHRTTTYPVTDEFDLGGLARR